ncbi:MAG: HlyD family efflux transporter periplasmic adaptor subunit [Acidobacteriota bacterium]
MESIMFKISRRFLYIIIFMTAALLIWACLCPWPSTVAGRFSLVGKNGTVNVISPGSGQVISTLAADGDWVKSGQALMEYQLSSGSKTMIKAPCSGFFISQEKSGQTLPTGVVARITDTGPVVLQMSITPENLGQVHQGMPVIVQLDAYPSQNYGTVQAKVSHISVIPTRQASDGTPMYEILANISSAPPAISSHLQPGLLGNAEIITGQQKVIDRLLP